MRGGGGRPGRKKPSTKYFKKNYIKKFLYLQYNNHNKINNKTLKFFGQFEQI